MAMSAEPHFTPANLLVAREVGRTSYPHMAPGDIPVWRRFLQTSTVQFRRFMYDVALGGRAGVGFDGSHSYGPLWANLVKKRIDVCAWAGPEIWIVEVKPIANFAALGQVLAYEWLAVREKPWAGKTRKVVVCSELDADLPGVYRDFGVTVFQVGVVLPPLPGRPGAV